MRKIAFTVSSTNTWVVIFFIVFSYLKAACDIVLYFLV